ncbi:secreted protein [gut metagenome]|uniref:Secreted protein n=1 Tax=gut metagenome TaxID=749906 RepID=J9GT57_9ZZZZ
MKVWKRVISAAMATVMVLCLPGPAWAAEKSAAGKESPWKQSWQAGDPTSSQAGTYQIYPVPQELTMTEGKALVLAEKDKGSCGQ